VSGQYIFAGSRTDTAPFEQAEGANLSVLYRGNHHQTKHQVRPDEQITVGLTGANVFNYPDGSGDRPVSASDRDLFTLLDNVANTIESGDTGQLQTLLGELDAQHQHTVSLRGEAGMLTRQCERSLTAADDTELLLKQILSDEESVDYTSAMVDLSNLDTAYQAALSLTSQMLQTPNLIDLLS
jgi:flagellar hook-associated protein 3 FlgL